MNPTSFLTFAIVLFTTVTACNFKSREERKSAQMEELSVLENKIEELEDRIGNKTTKRIDVKGFGDIIDSNDLSGSIVFF